MFTSTVLPKLSPRSKIVACIANACTPGIPRNSAASMRAWSSHLRTVLDRQKRLYTFA